MSKLLAIILCLLVITGNARVSFDNPVNGGRHEKKTIKILVLLPFFKNGGDTTMVTRAFSTSSLDYLAGLRVAADSLDKAGIYNAEIYIEDTELDDNLVAYHLNKKEYLDVDLVIGPVFNAGIEKALPIIRSHGALIYLPIEKEFKNSDLSQVFLHQKNDFAFAAFFFDYLTHNNQGREVILVKNGREGATADSLILMSWNQSPDSGSARLWDLAGKGIKDKLKSLDTALEYTFFINSKNNYNVNNALKQIVLLPHVRVYGPEDWLEFENPEHQRWDSLDLYFFSRFFVDYEDSGSTDFRKTIYENYNEEAPELSWRGFTDLIFFTGMIANSEEEWINDILQKEYPDLVSGYYWVKDPRNNGIYNGYYGIWRYQELKIQRR
jgi:hypothetical protein